jgi:hypothetical protein
MDNAFDYPFDSIPYIYKVSSNDKLVRLITWTVPMNGTYLYYGFVQTRANKKSSISHLTALHDVRTPTPQAIQEKLSPQAWFGALYTELIEKRDKDKIYYTLLGLSLNDEKTTKRVVDVLCVQNDSLLTFGAPIFEGKRRVVQHRMIFEYSRQSIMHLKYNKKLDVIGFSVLESMYPKLRGVYEFYVAGDSYDGLKFENGRWRYLERVNIPSDVKKKVRR